MASAIRAWYLLILLIPAAALGKPGDDPPAPISAEHALEAGTPAVLLTSGEVVEGPVEVVSRRGGIQQVIVRGHAHPLDRVHAYSTGGVVYGLVDVGLRQPLLVMRQEEGRAAMFREVDPEGTRNDFFQVGASPVLLASGQNLREAFAGDPAALRHLRRDRVLSFVGTGAFVIGAGLVATGAALEFGELAGPPGILIGLVGVGFAAAVNSLIPPARQQARRAAIDAYNR